jgi:hypothetical protein
MDREGHGGSPVRAHLNIGRLGIATEGDGTIHGAASTDRRRPETDANALSPDENSVARVVDTAVDLFDPPLGRRDEDRP